MALVRGKNTKVELCVRRSLHRAGLRYGLHSAGLPGRPDIVFRSRRAVVFVHGCFWHRHADPHCKLARLPKSRVEFWKAKLEGNRDRDVRNAAKLREMGWRVLVAWECQASDPEHLRALVEEVRSIAPRARFPRQDGAAKS